MQKGPKNPPKCIMNHYGLFIDQNNVQLDFYKAKQLTPNFITPITCSESLKQIRTI